jgi:nucleotide-binding universal stress UspA family protein
MFRKVLIPYDLSDRAQVSLKSGLKIASGKSSTVLHVVPFNEGIASFDVAPPSPEAQSGIQNLIAGQLKDLSSGESEVRVNWGEPVTEILNTSVDGGYDLIVMSTHGRSGLKHILLGSVTEKVVRHSPIPVMVARKDAKWPPKKVVLPLDFTSESDEALALAGQFVGATGCELWIIHVISMPDTYALWSELPNAPAPDMDELFRKNRERVAETVGKYSALEKAKIEVRVGHVHDEIIRFASEKKADLILLPTHAQKGLAHFFAGSESEQVVRHATCNVLCFCPGEGALERKRHLKGERQS